MLISEVSRNVCAEGCLLKSLRQKEFARTFASKGFGRALKRETLASKKFGQNISGNRHFPDFPLRRMLAYFGGCWAPNICTEHEPNIRMLWMLARSSFLVLLGPQRLVFPPCYQIIISLSSPDHSTKKVLRSFSVPSPGPKHKLGCLPLHQGSLPKNKATSGNNF